MGKVKRTSWGVRTLRVCSPPSPSAKTWRKGFMLLSSALKRCQISKKITSWKADRFWACASLAERPRAVPSIEPGPPLEDWYSTAVAFRTWFREPCLSVEWARYFGIALAVLLRPHLSFFFLYRKIDIFLVGWAFNPLCDYYWNMKHDILNVGRK